MNSQGVHLELTKDEALVLFEFLARFEDTSRLAFVDDAEVKLLGRLLGQLESRLVDIFMPNYDQLVRDARDRLRDPAE